MCCKMLSVALAERAGVEFQIINPEEDDEADEEELYGNLKHLLMILYLL